jgi:nickel-dependent lactate racemase
MRVQLAFGRRGLPAELPSGFDYRVLDAKSAEPLKNPVAALEAALDAPIGSAPLLERAKSSSSAAISVCDITRPAPNPIVLPPVLRRLEEGGIPRERIVILIATGLHRPATDHEIEEIVGEQIASRYAVLNHNARLLHEHRYLGTTASGTPAYIDERFVSADLRLTLGFIEPHLMAGFSGGRKLVVPGLAAQETIKVIHSPRFMREPRAIEGSIEENPLHRELLEIADMAGHGFMVDVALARDRKIAGVFAGAPQVAHAEGVRFVQAALLQQLNAPVDAVITTAAGHPLDLTYYQAVKGITAASHIVRKGGRILVVAECAEGPGGPEFCRLQLQYGDPEAFLRGIEGTEVTVDQWQLEKLALVARKAEILYYVPGLPHDFRRTLWGSGFERLSDALAAFFEGMPTGATVAVIPEGPYVLAQCQAAA